MKPIIIIQVYKTALHQYRPYLSLNDAFKIFKFSIENDFFKNDIYNLYLEILKSKNIKKIKKYKKIKNKFVASAIMNQLSYHVSKKKLNKEGLILKSNLDKDIISILKLLDKFKICKITKKIDKTIYVFWQKKHSLKWFFEKKRF